MNDPSAMNDQMQTKDWIMATVAGTALFWSIISFFWNRRRTNEAKEAANKADEHATDANTIAIKANAIAEMTGRRVSADTELSVLRLINEARMRANDLSVKLADLKGGQRRPSADETRHINALQTTHDDAVEVLLNSYELACGLFLDDKLDPDRFYRQYHDEIKSLYDNEPYNQRLHPPNSPYTAIRKVYDKWHNVENRTAPN